MVYWLYEQQNYQAYLLWRRVQLSQKCKTNNCWEDITRTELSDMR
jgi:hypothetical protein